MGESNGSWGLRGQKQKRPTWGVGGNDTDWAAAALRGSLAVLQKSPDVLVIIEGLAFATDLASVGSGTDVGKLHLHPGLAGHVVYEVHDYCWYHPEMLQSWIIYWMCCGWVLQLAWQCKRMHHVKQLDIMMTIAIAIGLFSNYWLSSYAYFEAVVSANWGFL